jgi:single-strand DNA-binding protein
VTFKNQAESCARFLKKGKPVMVEGRMQTSTWVDQAGVQQKRPEIVARVVKFLGTREDQSTVMAV